MYTHDVEYIIKLNPLVNGRKNASNSILCRSFGIDFALLSCSCSRFFFSTSILEENVRTFKALGPLSVSTALRAKGSREFRAIFLDITSVGVCLEAGSYWISNRGGSRSDGKDASAETWGSPMALLSSSLYPASSLAPRPKATSSEDL